MDSKTRWLTHRCNGCQFLTEDDRCAAFRYTKLARFRTGRFAGEVRRLRLCFDVERQLKELDMTQEDKDRAQHLLAETWIKKQREAKMVKLYPERLRALAEYIGKKDYEGGTASLIRHSGTLHFPEELHTVVTAVESLLDFIMLEDVRVERYLSSFGIDPYSEEVGNATPEFWEEAAKRRPKKEKLDGNC